MIEYSNFVYFKAFTNIYAVNVVAKNIRTFITTFLLLLLIILRINLQRMKIRQTMQFQINNYLKAVNQNLNKLQFLHLQHHKKLHKQNQSLHFWLNWYFFQSKKCLTYLIYLNSEYDFHSNTEPLIVYNKGIRIQLSHFML